MPFTPKAWQDSPSTATPISAAALVDLENRVTAASVPLVSKDVASGVAGLDAAGLLKIPEMPPSYVKDVASGVAGLDAAGLLKVPELPAVVPLTNAANTFTQAQTFASTLIGTSSFQTTSTKVDWWNTMSDISYGRPTSWHMLSFTNAPTPPTSPIDFHGLDLEVATSGGSSVSSFVGLYGIECNAQHSTVGTVGKVVSIYAFGNNVGGGTVTEMDSIQINSQHTTSSITTNYRGLYLRSPVVNTGATVGTATGLYLEEQKVAGVTSAYPIYSLGTTLSYFKGAIQTDTGLVANNTGNSAPVAITNSGTGNGISLVSNAAGIGISLTQNGAAVALSVAQNGGNSGFNLVASSGAAGFWPMVVQGYDYGPLFTTSADGHPNLTVAKNGTGLGTGFLLQNKGTGLSLDVQVGAGPTSTFTVDANGTLGIHAALNAANTATFFDGAGNAVITVLPAAQGFNIDTYGGATVDANAVLGVRPLPGKFGLVIKGAASQTGDLIQVRDSSNAQSGLRVTALGSLVLGKGAVLANAATDGFVYVPTVAGTPSGVPTAQVGSAATVYDTTANKLWVYNGAWRGIVLA